MDEEFNKRLCDYFTSAELVDVLDIAVEDLVPLIQEYIIEKRNELDEYTNYGIH